MVTASVLCVLEVVYGDCKCFIYVGRRKYFDLFDIIICCEGCSTMEKSFELGV